MNSSRTRGMSEGGLPWGVLLPVWRIWQWAAETSPRPRYTAAHLSSPPTKRGSFKALGPEFWRENWAMKCPPKLRKPLNLDEGTWYSLSHEASLLANLCFDCTIPNKSNNSQNSRWSWHSFLELCFAYCFSFLSSGLTKDRILGWTACFAWGGSDFG